MTIPKTIQGDGLVTMVRIIDEASPQIQATLQTIKPATSTALMAMGETIKESVKKSFNRAQYEHADHPVTVRYKMLTGGSPMALEETGALKEALDSCDVKLSFKGKRQSVTIAWDFPSAEGTGLAPGSRKDNSFMYFLAQEFGSTRMKKRLFVRDYEMGIEDKRWTLTPRPFFIRGVQEGTKAGEASMATALSSTVNMQGGIMRVKGKFMGYDSLGVSVFPSLVPHTMFGMGMYFVPPSRYYAVMGASGDLMGALKGSFSEKSTYGYIRQMLWGQVGFTKKSSRRKFRGRLWGKR